MSTHHEPSARAQGLRGLLSASPATEEEIVGIPCKYFQVLYSRRQALVTSTLITCLSDPEAIVLVALYEQPTRLLDLIPATDYVSVMVPILQSGDLNANSLEEHIKFLSSLPTGSVDMLELLFPYILASKPTFKHAKVVWMGIAVSVAPELKRLWTERFQGGKAKKTDMAYFNGELAEHLARMCRDAVPDSLASLTHTTGRYLEGPRLEEGLNFLVEQLGAPSHVSQALSLLVVYRLVNSADGATLLKIATMALNALENTNMGVLESAVGTNIEEVGFFFPHFIIWTNDDSARPSNWINFSGSVLTNLVTSPRCVSSRRRFFQSLRASLRAPHHLETGLPLNLWTSSNFLGGCTNFSIPPCPYPNPLLPSLSVISCFPSARIVYSSSPVSGQIPPLETFDTSHFGMEMRSCGLMLTRRANGLRRTSRSSGRLSLVR